jgi:hypothetical protein
MTEYPSNITGFTGVDTTTDPYILGKSYPAKAALSYNFRMKNGIRKMRGGWDPVLDFANSKYPVKSGVYFPDGAKAIVPMTKVAYTDTFYIPDQKICTIEFWMKASTSIFMRNVCRIPVDFTVSDNAEAIHHMRVYLVPGPNISLSHPSSTRLRFEAIVEESGVVARTIWTGTDEIKVDGKWHHYAIVRQAASDDLKYYEDGTALSDMTNTSGDQSKDFVTNTSLSKQDAPNYYNHIEIGSGELSIADFRIWDDERSGAEIAANNNDELTGTETDLVLWVPFNEGSGKVFSFYQPLVDSYSEDAYQGYLTPQEPFVNDDNELVFTGHNCMAYPTLRSNWDNGDEEDETTDHRDQNEDAAYDGGILWDTRLPLVDTTTEPDYNQDGVWHGVAQLRIRLRQLKEGVICGRLGLCKSDEQSDTKYRFFFYNESEGEAYVSDRNVDASDIGSEQTITIIYNSQGAALADRCKFYINEVDHTQVSSPPMSNCNDWSNGDEIDNSTYEPWQDPAADAEPDGALGGSTIHPEMCVAFDLIWMRQWWDKFPAAFEATPGDVVDATYDQETLQPRYQYLMKDISGHIVANQNYITFDTDTAVWNMGGVVQNKFLHYIKMPLNQGKVSWVKDATGGNDTHIVVDDAGTDKTFKQDILLKRILHWLHLSSTDVQVLRDDAAVVYQVKPEDDESKAYFNGAILSNLVNYFTPDTFKLNKIERAVIQETAGTTTYQADDYTTYSLRVFEAIEDDSPLQGIETFGSDTYKSRALLLGLDTRNNTSYGQESQRSQWCNGPWDHTNSLALTPATLPPIRGIFRYKSEDENINKLLVVSWCSIWTLNTNKLDENNYAWIDRNSDKPLNFEIVNNRLVVMDTKKAVKLNYLGKFSRLGIERPVDISVSPDKIGAGTDLFASPLQYGYVVQFYDSENNVHSGTIPVFSDQKQSLTLLGDASEGAVDQYFDFIDVQVRNCRDYNVDMIKYWRTLDMDGGSGTETEFFLINRGGASRVEGDYSKYRDVWADDDNLNLEAFLSADYIGKSVVPPPCEAMTVGFERLFLFGSENDKATLFYGNLDAAGLAIPDEVQPDNAIILEEGETTKGTALVWYLSVLFAFKENAIFKIQLSGTGFSSQLIYKGAGALNQRCVRTVENDVYFLDRNGLYMLGLGEPVFLTKDLIQYFQDEVDADQAKEVAFILHDKVDRVILIFVPSTGSTYCDRVIVFDLDTKKFTIDLIFDVTCGYVDDDDIYLGSPYGQIYKYNRSGTTDAVSATFTGTATSFDATSLSNTGASFGTDKSLQGAPVFAVDTSEHQIWKGIITSHTATVLTIDAWEPLFNASSDPETTNTLTYYIGYVFLYNKSPIYTLLNSQWEKQLSEYELITNNVSSIPVYFRIVYNQDSSVVHTRSGTIDGDTVRMHEQMGLHRNMQIEYAMVVNSQMDVKEMVFHSQWTRGQIDK